MVALFSTWLSRRLVATRWWWHGTTGWWLFDTRNFHHFHGNIKQQIAIYHAWDSTLLTNSLSKDQACFSPLYMKSNVSMQMLGTLDNMCNSSSKHKSPTEPFFFIRWHQQAENSTPQKVCFKLSLALSVLLNPWTLPQWPPDLMLGARAAESRGRGILKCAFRYH